MQFTGFALCFVCIHTVNAVGDGRKFLGPPSGPLWSESARKSQWAPGSNHHSRNPDKTAKALKDFEDFRKDWMLPFSSLKNILMTNWIEALVSSVLWMSLVVLTAFVYKYSSRYLPEIGAKSLDPSATQNELSEWQSEWYQCYRYPEICFWACCCPCVRWAHTMDLLQFLDFWPAFLIFFCLTALNEMTGFIFFGFFFTMMLVLYRQKMRKLFGMSNYATCTGYTADCLGFCFCSPCLIAQEANHVAQAAKLGWTTDLAVKAGVFSAKYAPDASSES